jgi:hypothetical protein
MDYILFFRAPDASALTVVPNPEEVGAIEWVTRERLADMMRPDSGLLWSPWFRIIAQRFLPTWWADLDVTLGTDTHVDAGTIHTVWCALPHPPRSALPLARVGRVSRRGSKMTNISTGGLRGHPRWWPLCAIVENRVLQAHCG